MLTNYVRISTLCSSMFSSPGKKSPVRKQQTRPTVTLPTFPVKSDLEFILPWLRGHQLSLHPRLGILPWLQPSIPGLPSSVQSKLPAPAPALLIGNFGHLRLETNLGQSKRVSDLFLHCLSLEQFKGMCSTFQYQRMDVSHRLSTSVGANIIKRRIIIYMVHVKRGCQACPEDH